MGLACREFAVSGVGTRKLFIGQINAHIFSQALSTTGLLMSDLPLPPSQLLENYMLANTAGFLIRTFREDSFVKKLHSVPVSELLSFLGEFGRKERATIQETVLAYCALIVLCESNEMSDLQRLNIASVAGLPWGDDVVALMRRTSPSENRLTLTVPSIRVQSNGVEAVEKPHNLFSDSLS
jgi:hypothetical protein